MIDVEKNMTDTGRNVITASRQSIPKPDKRKELEGLFTQALIEWDPLQIYLDNSKASNLEDFF